MYKTVFIDLDDTLWDFHTNAKTALLDVFETKNLVRYFRDYDHFFQLYIHKNYELWEQYGKGIISKSILQSERFAFPFREVGVEDSRIAKAVGDAYLQVLPTKMVLVDGAIELLDYLHPRYPLTIVSNGFKELQYSKMRSSNIEKYFQHIVLSEQAKALKPDPRIFEYALRLNNSLPSEAIMIGDSYDADIMGAHAAGIDQIFFCPTPRIDNLHRPFQPNWEIKTLSHITAIL